MVERRRPEDFLELVERARRGRLKLYLGFAAGVGKTYRMLEEAHELKQRGIDIVVGFAESHGRAETEALLPGLEVVARRKVRYRGVELEELDLDAIIARRPQVAIIDEVAHTNAPGSENHRRYEDILDVLDEGINVIAALNVQHLESLNDLVARTTGVQVRETVPDTFLLRADQVITLDLAVEDLLDRLRCGKIYAAEKIPWALEHFFSDRNLATLRELALREVAESLDRSGLLSAAREGGERGGAGAKVMVCISSRSPRAGPLLRRGSRMAGRLNTDWYAVYVETPKEAPDRIDSEAQRILHRNIEKARELGAEVVRLQATDPVAALLGFARTHGVGQVLIGRSQQPRWKSLLGRGIVQRMVREAEGLDLHVVSFEPGPGETPP